MTAATDIADALRWISPDCEREHWVRILMGIKSALGDQGRDIAEGWSQGSDRFNVRDFRDTWRSIAEGGGITAASLFKLARDAGWQGSAEPPPRPRQKPVELAPEPPRTLPFARAIWQRVKRDDACVAAHPYCIRKGITHAAGAGRATVSSPRIGQNIDCIVVPLRTLGGEFVGVECIDPDGRKTTLGSKGMLILGNDLDPALPMLVVEGWASAVHALNAYRWNACAVVAGGKHRLDKVAEELDRRYPTRQIVICAEQDA